MIPDYPLVDVVIQRSIDQVKSLEQEHGNDLAFVVNHSGGKDSTRMLGLIRNTFTALPKYAIMADTGIEHVSPISAIDFARARCAEFSMDLTVIRNQKRTYLERVEQRGMFPSSQYRRCTSDLKRGFNREVHPQHAAKGHPQPARAFEPRSPTHALNSPH